MGSLDPLTNCTVTPSRERENGTVLALAVCDARPDPKIENNEPPARGLAWKLAPFAMPFGAIVGWADASAATNRKERVQVRIEKQSLANYKPPAARRGCNSRKRIVNT